MTDLATPADLPEEELYGDLFTATGAEGDALLRAEVDHLRTQTNAQAEHMVELSSNLEQVTQEVWAFGQFCMHLAVAARATNRLQQRRHAGDIETSQTACLFRCR